MTQSNNNKSNGFYGPDGEFYPASSSAAQSQAASQSYVQGQDGELYPKRPDISYTTAPYPGSNPPAKMQGSYNQNVDRAPNTYSGPTKFCKFCGEKIPTDAVICTHCGRQVEELRQAPQQPQPVIINNTNSNYNTSTNVNNTCAGKPRDKWVAFFLCLFGGVIGLHKFYEGKFIWGLIYMFSGGLFGVGWFIDTIALLFKPNPYYV